MIGHEDPRQTIVELCRRFYAQGWASGTGGGVSIRQGERVFYAPSGVAKELMDPSDIFECRLDGSCVAAPADSSLKLSACAPLFQSVYELRDAGAVIHSHSIHAVMATLICGREFRVSQLEMMKGIRGVGFYDTMIIPVIENTAYEEELVDRLRLAIKAYPSAYAVLVRRHGVYIWGQDWLEAKRHAECYDYLFDAAVRMHNLGMPLVESQGMAAFDAMSKESSASPK